MEGEWGERYHTKNIVSSFHDFGYWNQTHFDVFMQIKLPFNCRPSEVEIDLRAYHIKVSVRRKKQRIVLLEGQLFAPVVHEDKIWTIWRGRYLQIHMPKANSADYDLFWTRLMETEYQLDPVIWVLMWHNYCQQEFHELYPMVPHNSTRLQRNRPRGCCF